MSCGDGYVDEEAGEDCDPASPDSFVGACNDVGRPEGTPACDPNTCELVADVRQCMLCGDEFVDGDEECDGDNLNGRTCQSGGQLQCNNCKLDYSACDTCGNGKYEEEFGEECDDNMQMDWFSSEDGTQQCTEIAAPAISGKGYSTGTVERCINCQWDRSGCSFCGDGERDPAFSTGIGGWMVPAEWCDGDAFDPDRLAERGECPEAGQQPNVECDSNCLSIRAREGQPNCCLKALQTCPGPADDIRCCYEYSHPDEDPCEITQFKSGEFRRECR